MPRRRKWCRWLFVPMGGTSGICFKDLIIYNIYIYIFKTCVCIYVYIFPHKWFLCVGIIGFNMQVEKAVAQYILQLYLCYSRGIIFVESPRNLMVASLFNCWHAISGSIVSCDAGPLVKNRWTQFRKRLLYELLLLLGWLYDFASADLVWKLWIKFTLALLGKLALGWLLTC